MTNNIEILLMVIAVNGCVLGLAAFALFLLNRAIDPFDRSNQPVRLAAAPPRRADSREAR